VELEITPEPDEDTRRAILAALDDENGRPALSPWAEALLPGHEDEDEAASKPGFGPAP
jgi:hypothetical protein